MARKTRSSKVSASRKRARGRVTAGKSAKVRKARRGRSDTTRVGISRETLGTALKEQIERFQLSRNETAPIVRDAASQVSRLMTGHVDEFSVERLVAWLARLGADVTISIRQAQRRGRLGKVRIRVT